MKVFTLITGVLALIVVVAVTIKYARKWKAQRDEKKGVEEVDDDGDSD